MNLLHISASPRGHLSYSRKLGAVLIERLSRVLPLRVVHRDLATAPPPLPNADFAAASLMPEAQRGPDEAEHLGVSEQLIAELVDSDAVVADMPMHNFTVPATFKAWIDMVARPGRTFQSLRHGKRGLLADRPVVLVVASGGPIGESAQPDFLTPYVRHVFATMGLHDFWPVCITGRRHGIPEIEAQECRALGNLDGIVAHLVADANRCRREAIATDKACSVYK